MITIVVREDQGLWCIERDGELLSKSADQDEAMIFALGEASRSFRQGRRAEVVVRPLGDARVALSA